MPEDIRQRIIAMHDWYCRNVLPGVRLGPEVERLWMEWFKAGFSGPDLRDVVRYLRRQIQAQKRNDGALKLTNLFERTEDGSFLRFAEDLGLARRQSMATRRLEPTPDMPATPPPRPSPAPPLAPEEEGTRIGNLLIKDPVAAAQALAEMKRFNETIAPKAKSK